MKIAEAIRKSTIKQVIVEEEALKIRIEGKSKKFVEKGTEVYAKA